MKVICSGCGIFLRDVPSDKFSDNVVSHGLCETCGFHFQAQAGMNLSEYLEGIQAPVVTVTPEGTINSANSKALDLLSKSPAKIQGQKGGDVFECEYAKLPEGCGETEHCSGCTIRNTVMDTLKTGNPHDKVRAYLQRDMDGKSAKVPLFISTEKKGGVVFLKIDEIG